MRQERLLNEGWLFHRGDIPVNRPVTKGPVYMQSKTERKLIGPAAYLYCDDPDPYAQPHEIRSQRWEPVTLPHDYVVDQDADENENSAFGYLHYDNAWYRKHFTLDRDAEGKRILLRFDGIAGRSTVYLNGCLMRHNFSAYNTFEVDISDYAYFDRENVLAVYVNTEEWEGWWYQGGGIYRDVHLTITEPVAIDLWGVYAPCRKTGDKTWQIDFETTVVNADYGDCDVRVLCRVLAPDGTCAVTAAGEGAVPLRDKAVIRCSATVTDPLLWDCDHPNLYAVRATLLREGRSVDETTTRIGFRTVELSREQGLLLNGRKTVIKGVCAHQDFGLTGLAVPDNVARYKLRLIKEMGANGYRTSHYQQTEAYMDALDEMGFLVMDEARWFENTPEAVEQLSALVRRDRNRPSVILWSTSNEEPHHVTDVGRRLHRAVAAQIRKLDNTRPITAAEDKEPELSTIYRDCDIAGINYHLEAYDAVHRMYPNKLLFASECCATGTTRDWNFATNDRGRVRDKDVDTNELFLGREKTWKFLMERPYVIGGFQWAAVEHRGEATWPALCSKSGALDLFLQKKGAFYQNRSLWTGAPMVHIVPHWNFRGMEGQPVLVTVYTNCDTLELFLNGNSLGVKRIERFGHGEWSVPYAPGTLEVRGYRQGVLAASDRRVTTGKPQSLRLTLDNDFTANGRDLALFTCECLDGEGLAVPDADELVHFSVAAPGRLIGTGSDNCDPIRISAPTRKMYMGKIRIAVKPAPGQKVLELMARSENCGIAVLRVPCE